MRRAAIILCAALVLGLPTISSAQYNDNDQQNPKEYHDEDSQFLAVVSYVFYPIGYAFEWLVARPLHYVANESPATPLTDSRIAELLGTQGIIVARRTIAKYREALSIPPVNMRKAM